MSLSNRSNVDEAEWLCFLLLVDFYGVAMVHMADARLGFPVLPCILDGQHPKSGACDHRLHTVVIVDCQSSETFHYRSPYMMR